MLLLVVDSRLDDAGDLPRRSRIQIRKKHQHLVVYVRPVFKDFFYGRARDVPPPVATMAFAGLYVI